MPYIKNERRQYLATDGSWPGVAGELNYLITKLCKDYYEFHGPSYQAINDCLGALEGAKLEFYRRIAVPYENDKCQTNGDCY